MVISGATREGRLVLFKGMAPERLYGSVNSLMAIDLKERQFYVNSVGSKIQKST